MATIGCAGGAAEAELPDKIEIFYFYENTCGSCDPEGEFIEIFNTKLADVKALYPHELRCFNIFHDAGKKWLEDICGKYGLELGIAGYPLMIINSKVWIGQEQIAGNLLEAFLVAGEDIFDHKYVYYPSAERETGLFERTVPDPDSNTLVYFYRITCEECGQTKPVIDELPQEIEVDGGMVPVDVVRFNTRSGNNGDKIAAFFAAYNVPDEDKLVPIVFLADEYLAGYEQISELLVLKLQQGAGLDFQMP